MTPELEWQKDLEQIREERERWHREFAQRHKHCARIQFCWAFGLLITAMGAGAGIAKLFF